MLPQPVKQIYSTGISKLIFSQKGLNNETFEQNFKVMIESFLSKCIRAAN